MTKKKKPPRKKAIQKAQDRKRARKDPLVQAIASQGLNQPILDPTQANNPNFTRGEAIRLLLSFEKFRQQILHDNALNSATIQELKTSTYSTFINLNTLIEYLNETEAINKEEYRSNLNRLIITVTGMDDTGRMHGSLELTSYQHGSEQERRIIYETDNVEGQSLGADSP